MVVANATTRASSARIDACAAAGVRSHTSCDSGVVVSMDMYPM